MCKFVSEIIFLYVFDYLIQEVRVALLSPLPCLFIMRDVFLSCDRFCWMRRNLRKQCLLTLIVQLCKLNMKMKTMTKRIMQENKR